MTLQEAKKKATELLLKSEILDADYDAEILLFEVMNMDKTSYLLRMQEEMEQEKEETFFSMVEMRAAHVPLQHLTKKAPFYGYEFEVNSKVLVPRFDTEVLVYEVLKREKDKNTSMLDLCTGSGCIAITLKKEGDYKYVVASDLSLEALQVAKRNAEKLNASIEFVESDLFAKISGSFDFIVSNPPYIRTDIIETLSEEVKNHDPMMALDGGETGLQFYEIIAREAGTYLKAQGRIYLEIGDEQGEDVKNLLLHAGFINVEVIQDLNLKDRVVLGEKKAQ